VEEQLGQLPVHQVLGGLSLGLVLRRVVVVPQKPQHLVPRTAQTHEHQQSLKYTQLISYLTELIWVKNSEIDFYT
jgi:esterase/lipase